MGPGSRSFHSLGRDDSGESRIDSQTLRMTELMRWPYRYPEPLPFTRTLLAVGPVSPASST
jgi:hypothetical protein